MKEVLYTIIFLLAVFLIFKGFLVDIAEELGIDLPTSATVFVSENAGSNWEHLDIGKSKVSGENVSFSMQDTLDFSLASSAGVFKIEDSKAVPQNTEIKKDIANGYISDFVQDPLRSNILYLISRNLTGSHLFVSYDYGENFEKIFVVDNEDKITTLEVSPIYPYTLYVGTQKGLFLESNDSGKTWQKKKSFSPQPILDIAINPRNENIYIALSRKVPDLFSIEQTKASNSKVLLSKDRGVSFSQIKKLNDKDILQIEVSSTSSKIYFVSRRKVFVLKGNSLSQLNLIASTKKSKIGAFTISSKNPNILYTGIEDILYRTDNAGKSWRTIESPRKGKKIKNIEISPKNPNIILLSVEN